MYLIGINLGGEWYWHQSLSIDTDQNSFGAIFDNKKKYLRFHEGRFQSMSVESVKTRPGAPYRRWSGTWVDVGESPVFAWRNDNANCR